MSKTKLIFFGDAPAANSGLARILRDLATRCHSEMSDTFDVCSLGYGSPGSSRLPFQQYNWNRRDDFLPLELPYIWDDFVGDDKAILLTIGDIQRFLPLADPKFSVDRKFADWLTIKRATGRLKLWGYFPIDAHGLGGKLPHQLAHTLTHYDRRLVPSEWALGIVKKTLPEIQCDVLPHGIDCEVFKPHPREESRNRIGELLGEVMVWPQQELNIAEDALWLGIVATNQSRKDWGLGIEVVAELAKTRPIFLWLHTDAIKREWSLLELLGEFNLLQSAMITVGNISDEVMAVGYSACDITLGIGRGEGFGYPIAESWSCGVPCVTGSYGAQAEFIPEACAVQPYKLRIEGPLNLMRPLYNVNEWADAVENAAGNDMVLNVSVDWRYLWQNFEKWFRSGVGDE